jgi:hypothetical protein
MFLVFLLKGFDYPIRSSFGGVPRVLSNFEPFAAHRLFGLEFGRGALEYDPSVAQAASCQVGRYHGLAYADRVLAFLVRMVN